MVGGLEAEHQQRPFARCAGDRGLGLVEQPAVRGLEAGLRQLAHRPRTGGEVAEMHARARAEARRPLDADPRLGDHTEDALGADQHPVRAGTGARARQAARLPDAARRDRADGLDEVVDVRRAGGVVTAGARGDPATDRGELPRLRVVAERDVVLAQLLGQPRPGYARLHARRQRDPVHLQNAVERAQVDRYRLVELAGLEAAHHAGAAAIWNRRGADVRAPLEHVLDVVLLARVCDNVGRIVDPPAE